MSLAAPLTRQRCFTHALREAVARCPGCERFFCRECVTEHEGRFLCASCLRTRLTAEKATAGEHWRRLAAGAQRLGALALSLLLLWSFFLLFGRLLINLPASFHEGTLWNTELLGNPEGAP